MQQEWKEQNVQKEERQQELVEEDQEGGGVAGVGEAAGRGVKEWQEESQSNRGCVATH